ncbi:4'-phosphopantetheinyl transferase [Schizophyllum commune H4-8]|uniref:4'-phosphopantetheinyl transferase domain-containing protein n=1 Tax=Schizophyllum commune (strain H4-8 / FGSC 9210) TaxID=578458 RepID=D8Q3Q1_SCHCM|nr:4'-phosphopantetheinyl transferase [Schizophyllum commune H4-8]KAI5892935.1 4'-phosphopantetheinyl transferase [Schizophyllum commune H4-8]
MAILGIGVDLVHVPHIAAALSRHPSRFPGRILSTSELSDWRKLADAAAAERVRFLAVRWAVKEAAYKALSAAYRPVWHELTYAHGLDGRPMLQYQPKEGPTPRLKALHTSVSHDGEYVIANVLAEEGGGCNRATPAKAPTFARPRAGLKA